jgi:hypothetical protein
LRTDDLIDLLATAQQPQPRQPPSLAIAVGGAVGLCLAIALTCITLGIRSDLFAAWSHPAVWLKLSITSLIVISAGSAARRLSLPGRDWRGAKYILAVTFIAVMLWAVADLIARPIGQWAGCIEGHDWSMCLIAIPLLSLLPMLTMGVAMRRLAPTRLRIAGALLGLASGAVGAMAFTLYCQDDAVSFVALWYGVALALSAVIGCILGPKLLRW